MHALVRPPAFRLEVPGVRVVPADLDRPEGLGYLASLPAPDVVCHLAADTRMNASSEEMERNVTGTANLLNCLGERIRGARFLFASSIAAVDRKRKPRGPLTTEDEPAPRSPYAKSKLASEELLAVEAATRDLKLTVLRLGTIYGPGQKSGGLVTLAEAARKGALPARLGWPGKISFGFVEDVAEVFFRLAEAEEPVTGTFFVSEGEPHTMAEAAEMLRDLTGAEWKRSLFPVWALKAINHVLWLPGIRQKAPWSLRAALADTISCDSEPIRSRLGLTFTPLAEGLRRTFS